MKTAVKKKRVKTPLLDRKVQYHMAMFLQNYPPREFNREFRNMFLEYLTYRGGGYNHRVNREKVIEGIWDLMRVLDEACDCWEYRDTDEIIIQYHGK